MGSTAIEAIDSCLFMVSGMLEDQDSSAALAYNDLDFVDQHLAFLRLSSSHWQLASHCRGQSLAVPHRWRILGTTFAAENLLRMDGGLIS